MGPCRRRKTRPYPDKYYTAREAAPLRAVSKRDRSVHDALAVQTDVARSDGSTLPSTTKSLGVHLASTHT